MNARIAHLNGITAFREPEERVIEPEEPPMSSATWRVVLLPGLVAEAPGEAVAEGTALARASAFNQGMGVDDAEAVFAIGGTAEPTSNKGVFLACGSFLENDEGVVERLESGLLDVNFSEAKRGPLMVEMLCSKIC